MLLCTSIFLGANNCVCLELSNCMCSEGYGILGCKRNKSSVRKSFVDDTLVICWSYKFTVYKLFVDDT